MAFDSRFFGSAGGDPREYTQLEFAEWVLSSKSSGYVPEEGNELQVMESSPAAMTVDVDTGQGYVQGYFAVNDVLEEVTIDPSHATLDRIDTVVMNLDILSTRLITPVVLLGTPAATPVPPTLQQDTNVWQVALADIFVEALAVSIVDEDITDRRIRVIGKHAHDNIAGKNLLINGNPIINQREVSGTVVLSSGDYGHDRWKAGTGGCTYTFSESQNVVTIDISAGTLMQEIEGKNIQTGTHIFHWQGTATGRINSASYTVSPQTGNLTGGTNAIVEFNTGTFSFAKLELGEIATPFVPKTEAEEKIDCQRYYWRIVQSGNSTIANGHAYTVENGRLHLMFPTEMRIPPTFGDGGTFQVLHLGGVIDVTLAASVNSTQMSRFDFFATGMTIGTPVILRHNASSHIDYDAEL